MQARHRNTVFDTPMQLVGIPPSPRTDRFASNQTHLPGAVTSQRCPCAALYAVLSARVEKDPPKRLTPLCAALAVSAFWGVEGSLPTSR